MNEVNENEGLSAYYRDIDATSIIYGKKYSPTALWEKAIEYFDWVEANPVKSHKVFGTGFASEEKRMRAMSIKAFCTFANISRSTFDNYRSNEGDYVNYLGITERIEAIIYNQKFEGASAGVLHASIISRDLGLVDKKDITSDGKPIESTVIVWGGKEIKV